VDDVIYGKDGGPRGAVIRKSGGKRGKLELLRRPLQKLYPLEISTHGEAKEKVRSWEGRMSKVVCERRMRKMVGCAVLQQKTRAGNPNSCLTHNLRQGGGNVGNPQLRLRHESLLFISYIGSLFHAVILRRYYAESH